MSAVFDKFEYCTPIDINVEGLFSCSKVGQNPNIIFSDAAQYSNMVRYSKTELKKNCTKLFRKWLNLLITVNMVGLVKL